MIDLGDQELVDWEAMEKMRALLVLGDGEGLTGAGKEAGGTTGRRILAFDGSGFSSKVEKDVATHEASHDAVEERSLGLPIHHLERQFLEFGEIADEG